jgi:Fe-S-cluster containining protein
VNDPGELCARCGLCCDGTLFDRAGVTDDEAPRLVALGLKVERRGDGVPGLLQPCMALDGTRCTAYAARPATCRQYECQLFAAYRDAEVSLDDALATIAKARELKREASPKLDAHLTRHFRGRLGRRA